MKSWDLLTQSKARAKADKKVVVLPETETEEHMKQLLRS